MMIIRSGRWAEPLVAALIATSLGACAADVTEPTAPAPSTPASSVVSSAAEPTWCEAAKFVEHHLRIDEIADHIGDPRASNPDWVYLEVLADTFAIAGPEVPLEDWDLEAIRESQDWIPDTSDGVVGVLRAGQLEYRIFDPSVSGYVMSLIPLEAEICLVGDRVISTFAFVAADTPGLLPGLRIEILVDGSVLAQTDPIAVEVAPPG